MELQAIQNKIYEIRGHKVMLGFDLANLYEVETKNLNLAVKRNIDRFPADFMFQLTKDEWESLRLQNETLNNNSLRLQNETLKGIYVEDLNNSKENLKLQNVISNRGRHTKYLPFAFTEQGLAMLSGILNSDKAINVNIAIMRAFVFIRQYALSHKDLTNKLKELESKYNKNFKDIYEALNYLLKKDKQLKEQYERKRIGFKND